MTRLKPAEVARRRVIERFDVTAGPGGGKAIITANGKNFEIRFDDLLDFVQAVEMIMLKLTGKVLNPKFRPEIKSRQALKQTKIIGGGYDLYTGSDAPLPAVTACEIALTMVPTHYLRVEIDGNAWDQWFGRLDELVKCLYIVVREAQGDPYQAPASVMVGASGPVRAPQAGSIIVPGAGHG